MVFGTDTNGSVLDTTAFRLNILAKRLSFVFFGQSTEN